MTKPNYDLRLKAKGCGVPLWMVADKLSVSEQTLIRKWRHELPSEEKAEVKKIILELSKQTAKK